MAGSGGTAKNLHGCGLSFFVWHPNPGISGVPSLLFVDTAEWSYFPVAVIPLAGVKQGSALTIC